MNLADLDLAELDIKKALEIDPNNRYIQSLADSISHQQTQSEVDWILIGVLLLGFGSNGFCFGPRDVKLEYKVLKEKVKEYNKKDAKFYGNMFAKLNKLESVELNVFSLAFGSFLSILLQSITN